MLGACGLRGEAESIRTVKPGEQKACGLTYRCNYLTVGCSIKKTEQEISRWCQVKEQEEQAEVKRVEIYKTAKNQECRQEIKSERKQKLRDGMGSRCSLSYATSRKTGFMNPCTHAGCS